MVPWWGWALIAFGGLWTGIALALVVLVGMFAIHEAAEDKRLAAERMQRRLRNGGGS
jgi:hypothetical protein